VMRRCQLHAPSSGTNGQEHVGPAVRGGHAVTDRPRVKSV
jgi:hypothetical protein